jgi:hypothetical protein
VPLLCGVYHLGTLARISHRPAWENDGPVVRSICVTNDGCPISARFWQMWDSTNVGPLSVKGVDDHGHQDLLPVESDRWTTVESHICQTRADMGHPSLVTHIVEKCGLAQG